jgi:hypothetical protein
MLLRERADAALPLFPPPQPAAAPLSRPLVLAVLLLIAPQIAPQEQPTPMLVLLAPPCLLKTLLLGPPLEAP